MKSWRIAQALFEVCEAKGFNSALKLSSGYVAAGIFLS